MDPQACLQRIFDLINDNDPDSYYAFEDLAEWLKKGGFPPVLKSLEFDGQPAMILHGRPVNLTDETGFGKPYYSIMVKDHLNKSGNGPYVFVIYDYFNGEELHRFDLPMERTPAKTA